MLNVHQLLQHLDTLTPSKKVLIAFSGGLDSSVLLHALVQANQVSKSLQLRAIYIDHGLQAIASQWSIHCHQFCQTLTVDCETIALGLKVQQGQSLEAVAREARYQAFATVLQRGEVLLTAHHQDDQAETLLIQLFRGAGVNGLAAMPAVTNFAKGQQIRPLLNTPRQALLEYAQHHNLAFIEDPSNQDQAFDRNYFRHQIVPRLKQRWPSMNQVLSRVAHHQAEAKYLLEEYLVSDLLTVQGEVENTLSIDQLKCYSLPRCKAIIRYFLAQQGFLAPSEKKLQHIISDVLNAKQEAIPKVHWQGVEVRRYQGDLYALSPLSQHNAQHVITWDGQHNLWLPSLNRVLKPEQLDDITPLRLKSNHKMEIRFRQGGEKIYQQHRHCHCSLKHYFQEVKIPPWERSRIPLLYIDGRLVKVMI